MLLSKIIKNVAMTITKMMKPMIDILNSLNMKLLSTILLSSPVIMLPLRVKDWDRALVESTAATLLDEESNIPACCT